MNQRDDRGWRRADQRASGAEAFVVSPFTRLARTHAFSVAGDTMIAIALANSLFFSIDPSAARGRVALYLLLTMAPFAIVAPFIGPVIDRVRGGRRWMIVGSASMRAVICFFMISGIDSLLVFPEAFAMLVLGKSYQVAKSAVVPTTVGSDEALVEANSKLSVISGLSSFAAATPALVLSWLGGVEWTLGTAVAVFAVASVLALRIPATRIAAEPPGDAERAELRSAGILLAASAMGLLRGIVGFVVFLLAFDLRAEGAPAWQFGLILAVSATSALGAAFATPYLRARVPEENILIGALGLTVVGGVVTAWLGGLIGAALVAGCVGVAASAGKLAFDSIVQRDAPDANRGRSFARFEARFQVAWVAGAFIPVVIPLPARLGYLVVAAAAGFAAFSYLVGRRAARERASQRRPDDT